MQCIACKETIVDNAPYCHYCSHYQKNWRNELKYFSSIIGLITVVISGTLFTITLWPKIQDFFYPNKSIEILNFQDNFWSREISIHNKSKSDVWLRDIDLYVNGEAFVADGSVKTSQKIEPGEIYVFSEKKNTPPDGIEFVQTNTYKSWVNLIAKSQLGCYSIWIWNEGSTGMGVYLKGIGISQGMVKGEAIFEYYFANTGEWLFATTQVNMILVKDEPRCGANDT